jgi:hypothetical protein
MNDNRKVMEENPETESLSRRVEALERENQMLRQALEESDASSNQRREPRQVVSADIEFIANFDVLEATAINLSEGGICFEVDREITFDMQFEIDDQSYNRRARLAWMQRLPDGRYRFGFSFIPQDPLYPRF